jgi:hypothetical protein
MTWRMAAVGRVLVSLKRSIIVQAIVIAGREA